MRSIVFEGDTWELYRICAGATPRCTKTSAGNSRNAAGRPRLRTGKPEPLKHALSSLWSRRLSSRTGSSTDSTKTLST